MSLVNKKKKIWAPMGLCKQASLVFVLDFCCFFWAQLGSPTSLVLILVEGIVWKKGIEELEAALSKPGKATERKKTTPVIAVFSCVFGYAPLHRVSALSNGTKKQVANIGMFVPTVPTSS